jgi:hypothetical protein
LPRIRFSNLPRGLWEHLLGRAQEREISLADLGRLQQWVKSEPFGPAGEWYKDFGSFKLGGSGEYPRTVLTKGIGTRLAKKSNKNELVRATFRSA